MNDDSIIALSDDEDDCDKFFSKKSSENTQTKVLLNKTDSDISESEFPSVRFSEINCQTNSINNVNDEDHNLSYLSDYNYIHENNFEDSITNKFFDSPIIEKNNSDHELQKVLEKKVNTKTKKTDEEKFDETEKVVQKTVKKRKKVASQQEVVINNDENCFESKKKRGPNASSKTNPKDLIKMMEVIIDDEIKNYDFFDDLCKTFQENQINFKINSQLTPKSISWKRKIDEQDSVDEDRVLIIWDCKETFNRISDNTIDSAVARIKKFMPNKKISLVIYKIQSYFKRSKSTESQTTQNNSENSKQKKSKKDKGFSDYPKISQKQFNESLVKLQVLHDIHLRTIENPDEIVMLIQQYTKSLSNLSSKMEKDKMLSELDWCISVDNKDSVKIDKEGNGMARLWQQQLCQFAQTSLETSEAIATVYKSPLQLMEAYAKCNRIEGETLLKDIHIRRNAGIITSSKKIGPELSKKIYVMFTTSDGNVYLNESQD